MHPSRSVLRAPLLQAAAVLLGALTALALLVGLRPGPLPLDRGVHDWLVAHRHGPVTTIAKVATFTGSGPFVVVMTLIGAALLWRWRGRVTALALPVTVFGGAAVSGLLKIVVSRQRPDARDMLGTAEATLSFPSGHTVSGCLLYIGAALIVTLAATLAVRVAAICAAAAWSLVIGWSRLYLGFHWLSDVAASALLATAVLLTCAYVLRHTALRGPAEGRQPLLKQPPRTRSLHAP